MQNKGVVALDNSLFRPLTPSKEMVDPSTLLHYTNVVDAIIDAAYFSMKNLNITDVVVLVTETGWPSKVDSKEPYATIDNADAYNSNLIKHVLDRIGTPHPEVTSITVQTMEVIVLYSEGNLSVMIPEYHQNPTVLHLKQNIQQLILVKPEWQGLYFNGKQLLNSARVQDCGIEQGSVISLIRFFQVSLEYEHIRHRVLINEQTKVIYLKEQVLNRFGLAIEEQMLIFNMQVLQDEADVEYYPNITIFVLKTYIVWIRHGNNRLFAFVVHRYMSVKSVKRSLHKRHGLEISNISLKKLGSNWLLTDQTILGAAGINADDEIEIFYE
ncbi:hypothetical protein GH714_000628 [Hevea brasiliensis]|uniref:glucan endo-1,3-beta-D-glucosidase n=1 Tax=Hevea brasiliensis TaxID=3981 RepID=A0A6A6LTZ5_HEVBR|nr:hypothetical protein GH714_000628 [Hevea brasiliensis]